MGSNGFGFRDHSQATAIRRPRHVDGLRLRGRYVVECFHAPTFLERMLSRLLGPGWLRLKWRDEVHNLIVNQGLDYALGVTLGLAGVSQITAWYIGLINASPAPGAGDLMSSHGGWTENTNYTEANRQAWTPGTLASQSVDNSASKAQFTINANSQSLGGCFLVGGTGAGTKGAGTGTLFSAGPFDLGNKSADTGDLIQVTWECESADAGA